MREMVLGQLFFFGASICFGACILFVYDVIRAFRRVVIHSGFFVSVEDLLFWIFVGVATFQFLYWYNQGQLRGFFFFGLATGMVLYYKLISRHILSKITKIMDYIGFIPRKIFRLFKGFLTSLKIHFKWQLKKEQKEVKMALGKRNRRGGNYGNKKST